MTDQEYNDFAEQIAAQGRDAYLHVRGRTATTLDELDFIRQAEKNTSPAETFVREVAATGPDLGLSASEKSKAFTPEYVQATSLPGTSATAIGGSNTPAAVAPALPDALPQSTVDALKEAGYDSAEKIAAASDEDLKKVPGVGDATVAKLRSMQGA